MSDFDSVLLPLDGSLEATKAAGCASWLAQKLGATLHVLHPKGRPLPPPEVLEHLRLPAPKPARLVLHPTSEDPVEAVPKEIARLGVKLVVMSARGGWLKEHVDPGRGLMQAAKVLLEASSVPIILMPFHYLPLLPWRSMVVAASGEAAADEALGTAVRLAGALELGVNVVHVVAGPTSPLVERYTDAPQHEFSQRLEELVERGLQLASPEEKRRIEAVSVRRGDPAQELLAEVDVRRASVLAAGWHGALGGARARVLTHLLERAVCPLLLVRQAGRSDLRLKVGDAIGER